MIDTQENHPHPTYRTEPDVRKIEMPLFQEKKPDMWLFQVSTILHLHEVKESAFALGPAQFWLQVEEKKMPFISWQELKTQLTWRFKGTQSMSLRQRFL